MQIAILNYSNAIFSMLNRVRNVLDKNIEVLPPILLSCAATVKHSLYIQNLNLYFSYIDFREFFWNQHYIGLEENFRIQQSLVRKYLC